MDLTSRQQSVDGIRCLRPIFRGGLRLAGIALLAASTQFARADATDTPDPKLVEAQLKQKLAEAKQATAEAELATSKAQLGALTATLPKGTTTSTTQHVESSILAYRAAASAAAGIAKDLSGQDKPAQVGLFSQKEFSALTFYRAFKVQADLLNARVPAITTMPKLGTDPMPANCATADRPSRIAPLLLVDTAVQLLGLVKTDRSITGSDVTIDDFALNASVAHELLKAGIKLAYPPTYLPNALNPNPPVSQLNLTFQTLSQNQTRLGVFVNQVADKKKLVAAAKERASAACKDLFDDDVKTLDAVGGQASAVQTAIGQVLAGLTAADAQSGATLIQSLTSAELLASGFSGAYVLQIKPIAAGGAVQTATNVFRTKLSFSGGVVLSYMLFDPNGAVVHAGTVPFYGGYVDAGDLKNE